MHLYQVIRRWHGKQTLCSNLRSPVMTVRP